MIYTSNITNRKSCLFAYKKKQSIQREKVISKILAFFFFNTKSQYLERAPVCGCCSCGLRPSRRYFGKIPRSKKNWKKLNLKESVVTKINLTPVFELLVHLESLVFLYFSLKKLLESISI